MLILFDHGTPRGIARALQDHAVKEARAQGWDTLSNGDLLEAAEDVAPPPRRQLSGLQEDAPFR